MGQGGDLGRNLQQLARLIKADAGVEAAFAEIGYFTMCVRSFSFCVQNISKISLSGTRS